MQYRNDIQVMRGLAVILVVLFHLGLSPFSNGFLGVDVFFVISGFLMALLFRPGETISFYKRRASRLLPAYFATLIAVVLVSSFIVLPTEHMQVVDQGFYASVLAPNIGFWMQNSYFSKAEFTPLLHFWSLGVELQFYLLVPLLFWLHYKSRFILPVLLVGSLAATLLVVTISPKTGFFMMPFRIWQFLIGGAVAYYMTNRGSIITNRPFVGLGALCGLAALIFAYPVDGRVTGPVAGHPGLTAAIVTALTGIILAFGLPAKLVDQALGRALAKIGDWSYSIYLAHFPVVVFVLYQPFSGTMLTPETASEYALIAGLIIICSTILYRFFDSQRRWKGSVLGALAMIVTGGLVSFVTSHTVLRGYTAEQRAVFAANEDRSTYRCGKLVRIISPTSTICEISEGMAADAPAILLVGDSHTDALKTSAAAVAQENGYRLYITVSNAPLVGSPDSEATIAIIKELGVAGVLVHYAHQNAFKALDTGFAQELGKDIPVVWLLPIPRYTESVPQIIWEDMQAGRPIEQTPENLADIAAFTAQIEAQGLTAVSLQPALCTPACQIIDNAGKPLYFDAHHLTLTGARKTEVLLKKAVDMIGSKPK